MFYEKSNEVELLLFYADWCPFCKEANPAWNELKTDYENKSINGYKIIFTEIDCSNQDDIEVSKIMDKYSIEGYPTIKLIKDGQLIDFDAKPSKDNLISFINNVLRNTNWLEVFSHRTHRFRKIHIFDRVP
jgi:thioredoxin domain-containing protein 10